jgi:6-phosphogluconolactonase
LKSIAGDPPHLDLALVGVGEDGHVASIFKNRAAHHDPVEPVYDAPKPPARRLTLTLPVLAGAGLVVVAAFGSSKADVMRAALSRSDAVTPIAELLRRADSPLVLLDPDAGLS